LGKREVISSLSLVGISAFAGKITAELINEVVKNTTNLTPDDLAKMGKGVGEIGGEIANSIINADNLVNALLELSGVTNGIFENIGAVLYILTNNLNSAVNNVNAIIYDINTLDIQGLAMNPAFCTLVWLSVMGLIIKKIKKNKDNKFKAKNLQ